MNIDKIKRLEDALKDLGIEEISELKVGFDTVADVLTSCMSVTSSEKHIPLQRTNLSPRVQALVEHATCANHVLTTPEIISIIHGRKIEAIKSVRARVFDHQGHIGLAEAKELVDYCCERWPTQVCV